MKYSWDETKRLKNLQKHRLDFADVVRIFDGPTLTMPDDRADYGEARFITMGLLKTAVVVIAHTENESEIRIISMRKAERYETEIFFSCA
ncbi:MAG: BrnT family toxin [Deltaproteobacteria bacterium]|nr:BrnT family toxin [Deltaproteobacteria bacterium]